MISRRTGGKPHCFAVITANWSIPGPALDCLNIYGFAGTLCLSTCFTIMERVSPNPLGEVFTDRQRRSSIDYAMRCAFPICLDPPSPRIGELLKQLSDNKKLDYTWED
jgi:hypothetical protein